MTGGGAGIGPAPFGGLFTYGLTQPGLEGAAVHGRMAPFQSVQAHINSLMRNAGPTVQARARWLVRNNCYAMAAVRSWVSATVGTGIKPVSKVDDEDLREAIH